MSATPVGDWIRKRYPPNDGATHYLGNDGDPGCCAGPHPLCTYQAAFLEGADTEREHIYAELGNDHYVIFKPDGWTTEHSVECRLSGQMSECAWHEAVKRVTDDYDPDMAGRWRITDIDSEGLPSLERAEGIS